MTLAHALSIGDNTDTLPLAQDFEPTPPRAADCREANMTRTLIERIALAILVASVSLTSIVADEPPALTAPKLSGPLGQSVPLFNGQNLEGWVWYQRPPKPGDGRRSASTRCGRFATVCCIPRGSRPATSAARGSLKTPVLTVEQRHVSKGNGGVLFGISGPDKIWPHCLEVQGANGEEGDIRNIAEFPALKMDPDRVEPKRLKRLGPDPEKPPGEWETIQVFVDHGQIAVLVNGQLQNVTSTAKPGRPDRPAGGRRGDGVSQNRGRADLAAIGRAIRLAKAGWENRRSASTGPRISAPIRRVFGDAGIIQNLDGGRRAEIRPVRRTQTTFLSGVTSTSCGPLPLPPREQMIVLPLARRVQDCVLMNRYCFRQIVGLELPDGLALLVDFERELVRFVRDQRIAVLQADRGPGRS